MRSRERGRRHFAVAVAVLGLLGVLLAAPAEAAFPGTNGRIAFIATTPSDLSGSVYTINPDGTGLTGLTVGQRGEAHPAWSSDGMKIAYQEVTTSTIRKMDFDGRANVHVFAGGSIPTNPAWSPDGTQIAIKGGPSGNNIVVLNADGSGAHNVATGFPPNDPAWSPDGSKIAFTRSLSGRVDIWTVAPDATGLTNLTADAPSGSREPNWSPDGSKIVYRFGTEVWTMNADGTGKTMIRASATEPAWSPDGTRIVYKGAGGLHTMDPDGANDVLLSAGSDFSPDWQPCPATCPTSTAVPHDTPAAAFQAYISFVPNYRQTINDAQCEARGGVVSQHGAPLAFSSCNPPQLLPGTVAHQGPDGESGVIYTGGSGLAIEGGGTDIRTGAAGGTDYNPPGSQDATLVTKVRVTDTFNGPGLNESATSADFDLSFPIACSPDPDPAFGSTCAGSTSSGALLGSEAFRPYRNTAIQLFEVRMKDIGLNGTLGDADDQSFVIQGISIP